MTFEDEIVSLEEVMKKTDTIMNKVKFKTFGKTKPISNKTRHSRLELRLPAAQGLDCDNKVKESMRRQYDQMEDEINKLKLARYERATNVHKIKENVTGSKKDN